MNLSVNYQSSWQRTSDQLIKLEVSLDAWSLGQDNGLSALWGEEEGTIYVPIATEGSGTPTTRP